MKRVLLSLSLIIALVSVSMAQVGTADSSHFTAGVVVDPASLPCITQGQTYSGTVNIRIPDSVDASVFVSGLPPNTYFFYVDSIRLDSLTGAPAGISTATNPGSGTWLHAGQYGCVQVSGTTTAAVGTFPLSIYGSGCVHGSVNGFAIDSCQTGLLPPFINYSLSVCAAPVTGICTPDSAHLTGSNFFYPASLPCILQGAPYAGTVSLRIPDSIDANIFVSQLPAGRYYLHIDSMRIDSLVGTPSGITAVTNPSDSVWIHAGGYGCAQFSGTTNAVQGNYPLNLYGRGCVHGNILGFAIDTCIDGSLGAYFRYSLNVCSANGACTVDTTHFSNTTRVYPSSLPCILTGIPYAEQINIQVPPTLDAHDFFALIPAGTLAITIDSINIDNISGYPAGISSVSNPVLTSWLKPLSYACAAVSGTVNAPIGDYPLTISGIGCGHGTFPLVGAVDTCMAVTFSRVYPYTVSVCYPAGVNEVSENAVISIYPNPNQGVFTVSLSAEHISGQMTVLDQLGRIVHSQYVDVTGTRQIAMELGNIAPGVYVLSVNSANGRIVKEFVVR